MPVETELAAVILAGGRGTRMGGADKGLLEYQGRPLVEWVIEALRPQVGEILISANRNLETYSAYGYRVLPDTLPDYPGPLAGVLAAMAAVDTAWLLTVSCDTPLLPANLVQCLWQAATQDDRPIAVAADSTRTHYTLMLVQTRLADSLRDYLQSGQRAVHAWQAQFSPAQQVFADSSLANFNKPADMRPTLAG